VEEAWECDAATDAGAHIFEDVVWPLNAELSARVENIINIARFTRNDSGDAFSLSFSYSLQCCVRSSFGIGFEPAGLDLDGGKVSLRAIPLDPILGMPSAKYVDQSSSSPADFHMNGIPLGHLRRRDLVEMQSVTEPGRLQNLIEGTIGPDDVTPTEVLATLGHLGCALTDEWKEFAPFYLLDIEASKQLHFTVPENGPLELWQVLTWTAPSLLFLFLNRAVTLAPHLLMLKRLESSTETHPWTPTTA
jgi:hypothetical protein